MLNVIRWITGVVFLTVLSVAGVQAQATRTWVSGVGDDANPCSRTAPCKTFAGAISKTATSGEINVLDPGGFGTVTITKAITIDGSGGSIAGVLSAGVTGIVVNATGANANAVVILRNLDINGAGTGTNGIRFLSGGALYVENTQIYGFTQYGIDFEPSGSSDLSIDRTLVRESLGGGLAIRPGALGSATATIANSRFENNFVGVRANDRSAVTITGSVASGNTNGGFSAGSTTDPVEINLEGCVASNNGFGVVANGAAATVRTSNSFITHNGTGISAAGGSVVSFGNNRIAGNTTNGAPTSTIAQQ